MLDAIAEKKISFIREATTKAQLQKIARVDTVSFTGAKWITNEYWIPEEELIAWSETSLKAPLNDIGFRRYMDVFKLVYGMSVEDFQETKNATKEAVSK